MNVLQINLGSGSTFDFIASALICLMVAISPFVLLGMLVDLIAREGPIVTAMLGGIWNLGLYASVSVYPRVPEETLFGPDAAHWTWLSIWAPVVWLGIIVLFGVIKVVSALSLSGSTTPESHKAQGPTSDEGAASPGQEDSVESAPSTVSPNLGKALHRD